MRDRMAHDAGADGLVMRRALLGARRCVEQRQQRQAEDREMIALDLLEQMNSGSLQLIGADAARSPPAPAASR